MASFLVSYLAVAAAAAPGDASTGVLRDALTFHVSFDGGADASFGRGDRRIHTTPTGKTKDGKPGLTHEGIAVAKGKGRHGDALRFHAREKAFVFYRAEKNVDYRRKSFSGTVSFWLSLDPNKDLEPGWCDPLQITDKQWNDAAMFVDFTKDERPRHFRFGVFADSKVWNPKGTEWDAVPAKDRPFITVKTPPFGSGKWTHVVITFADFNTDGIGGVAKLYLNGKCQGALKGRPQVFTWDPSKTTIQLGLSYIGLLDDLAVFKRALSDDEVMAVYKLPEGAGSLHRKK